MSPQAAQALLLGLADEALSGRTGEVVCLEAPQWPPLPASLRRQLDGRSVYTRPGAARYATTAQLTLEDRLVAHAQTQGAPRLPGDLAARRLGADQAAARGGSCAAARTTHASAPRRAGCGWTRPPPSGTCSPRPAPSRSSPGRPGPGKPGSWPPPPGAWDGPVFGTATSQNATNELRAAGVQVAANTTRLLTDLTEGRIPPGSLILADEGSMISIDPPGRARRATRPGTAASWCWPGTRNSSPPSKAAAP